MNVWIRPRSAGSSDQARTETGGGGGTIGEEDGGVDAVLLEQRAVDRASLLEEAFQVVHARQLSRRDDLP
jgi:hypothetical protein